MPKDSAAAARPALVEWVIVPAFAMALFLTHPLAPAGLVRIREVSPEWVLRLVWDSRQGSPGGVARSPKRERMKERKGFVRSSISGSKNFRRPCAKRGQE